MKAEAELINISRARIGLMRNLKQSTCTARAMRRQDVISRKEMMNLNDKEFVLCPEHCHLEDEKKKMQNARRKRLRYETGWHMICLSWKMKVIPLNFPRVRFDSLKAKVYFLFIFTTHIQEWVCRSK